MIDQLISRSERHDEHKTDYGPAPVKEYGFDDVAALVAPTGLWGNGHVRLAPTEWAFRQVCQKLGPAAFPNSSKMLPADYLWACPPGMRANQLNHWIGVLPQDRQWFVRAYDDAARAVLSDRYADVGVTDTLKWVKSALDSKGINGGITVHNPVVTPDVLHLRLLFRTINRDSGNYAVGGYFTTGEIGNRKLGAYPLVQRISCTNSIVVPHNQWSWDSRHIGDTHVLKNLFISAIFGVLKGAVEALDQLLEAQNEELPDFTEYVDDLVKAKGWNTEVRDSILIGSEGYETLFGVIQGVSAAANTITWDDDLQADMQLAAGQLLVRRRWNGSTG
jgi:hypothetical protein